MISFMIQQVLFQNFSPKIGEIGIFFYNFSLPVKPGFTGYIGKPVLPVFTSFYRYKFSTLMISNRADLGTYTNMESVGKLRHFLFSY